MYCFPTFKSNKFWYLVYNFSHINNFIEYNCTIHVWNDISTVVKSLGICYLTQLASETCRDSGYSAIATKIELTGKVTIILMALPMFLDLMQIIQRMVYLN